MARIAGVNLPNGKHAEIALTYIYGIGRTASQKILDKLGIERTKKIDILPESDLDKIRDEIKESHLVE
jgi:small subunit ribosomal protein S13